MPYNPGITYRGGEYLADAIGSAGSDLGYGLERRLSRNRADKLLAQEKQEAREKEDKRRAKEWQSYAGIAETSELATKDQLEVMSLEEVKGMVEGAKLKQFFEKNDLDMELLREQLAGRQQENALAETLAPMKYESEAAKLRKYRDEDEQGSAALRFQGGMGGDGPKDLGGIMAVANQAGYRISPQDAEKLTEALTAGKPFVPTVGEVGGMRYGTTSGKSAQWFPEMDPNNPRYNHPGGNVRIDPVAITGQMTKLRELMRSYSTTPEEKAELQAELDYLKQLRDGGARAPAGGAQPAAAKPTTGGGGGGGARSAKTLPKVTTQAEFDALPIGTRYVGKDGREATKR